MKYCTQLFFDLHAVTLVTDSYYSVLTYRNLTHAYTQCFIEMGIIDIQSFLCNMNKA